MKISTLKDAASALVRLTELQQTLKVWFSVQGVGIAALDVTEVVIHRAHDGEPIGIVFGGKGSKIDFSAMAVARCTFEGQYEEFESGKLVLKFDMAIKWAEVSATCAISCEIVRPPVTRPPVLQEMLFRLAAGVSCGSLWMIPCCSLSLHTMPAAK